MNTNTRDRAFYDIAQEHGMQVDLPDYPEDATVFRTGRMIDSCRVDHTFYFVGSPDECIAAKLAVREAMH